MQRVGWHLLSAERTIWGPRDDGPGTSVTEYLSLLYDGRLWDGRKSKGFVAVEQLSEADIVRLGKFIH
jgi:hypothetical protein